MYNLSMPLDEFEAPWYCDMQHNQMNMAEVLCVRECKSLTTHQGTVVFVKGGILKTV